MMDHVDHISPPACDHIHGCSLDHKAVRCPSRTGNSAVTVGKVHDHRITDVDDVVLKWHTMVLSPNEKVISSRQGFFPVIRKSCGLIGPSIDPRTPF